MAKLLRIETPEYIKGILDREDYIIKGSPGMGNWSQLPWIGVFDPNVTKGAQSGYYIVYLFKENMQGVYLSINQGVTDLRNKYGDRKALEILRDNAQEFRNEIDVSNDLEIDISLGKGNYAPFYEAGNIYAKYYSAEDLPSEDVFISDLNEFLRMFNLISESNDQETPNVYLLVTKGPENWDDLENKDEDTWTAHPNTKKDDILLMYNTSPRSRIDFIFKAADDAYEDPSYKEMWNASAVDITNKIKILNPITFQDMKENEILSRWKAIKMSFMGTYFDLSEEEWKEMKKLILNKNPELEKQITDLETLNISSKNNNEPKLWKITPGESHSIERLWPIFRDNGYIGIGWFGDKGLIQKDYREFQTAEEIKDFLIKHEKKSDKTTSHKMIWNFTHNIKKGDYVVANGGRNRILGIGIINSDYISPNDSENPQFDKEYNHIRKVDWIITEEFELKEKFFFGRDTINELKISKWNEILIRYYKLKDFNLIRKLFNEFSKEYLSTIIGKTHINSYDEESIIIKDYFKQIKDNTKIVDNITDPIINYIVPIKRPSVSTVGFKSFKAFGFTDKQLPSLTWAIINLINNLINSKDKKEQENIIKSFKSSDYSKGSQTGVISPLIHGLNPKYLIINRKTIDTIKLISQILDIPININTDLLDYIDNNEKLKNFLDNILKEIPEFSDFHIFDAFCHWICDKSLAGYATVTPLPIFKVISNGYNYKSFNEFLVDKGYHFEPEMIENFLLSLKVKPFVILTGNSGTGKTKIAQLFAQYLSIENTNLNTFKTEVKVGQAANSGGWALNKAEFFEFSPELKDFENTYDIKVDNVKGKGTLKHWPYLFFDKTDDNITKRLKQLSKNNTEKTSLEIIMPENNESRHEIIPVGANWTENRHIIGFYNVITENYQKTPALKLILEARNNKSYPHFLMLDEMNLSHVERYFADFLSVMESGEKMPLHNNKVNDIPSKLGIPENLLVIGTVNVDETTYMFSPKVLDRANTIEFSTYPARNYMMEDYEYNNPKGNIGYLENPLSNLETRNYKIEELKDKLASVKIEDDIYLWDVLSEEINEFQEVLGKAGFDFGFRVINEILRFMYVAWIYENEPEIWDNWMRYFDAQIKQKMLPKLHGSQRVLENVLKGLFELCYMGSVDISPRYFEGLELDAKVKYLSSAKKIQQMDKVLNEQRYVSFIN